MPIFLDFGRLLELGDTLRADGMDDTSKLLDPLAEPRQFVPVDPVMLGVARLDVGVLELFEPCAILPVRAWPYVEKPAVEPFGLGAQEG